jgi:transposase InsO family protein
MRPIRHIILLPPLRISILKYIEMYYNQSRRHSALNYKSTVDFERLTGVT